MSAIVIFTGDNEKLLGESLDLMAHRGEEKTIYESVDGFQMASTAGRAFSASKCDIHPQKARPLSTFSSVSAGIGLV